MRRTHLNWTRITAAAGALVLTGAAQTFAADAAGTPERPAAERLWYAQGLTHPAVVHVPIALTLAAAIAVVLRVAFRRISLGIVYYCLLIGALGAIPSTLAGWAWAPQKDSAYVDIWDMDSGIFWHRWGGVALTVANLAVAVWATFRIRAKTRHEARVVVTTDRPADDKRVVEVERDVVTARAPGQFGWQFATILIAVGMGWVAHSGGEQVYPGNFEKIVAIATGAEPVKLKGQGPKKDKAVLVSADAGANAGAAGGSTAGGATISGPATGPALTPGVPTTGPSVAAATQPAVVSPATPVVAMAASGKVDFARQVWPIWQEKCIYCHGAEKQKGKLRMDTEEACKEGGTDNGPLYTAGKGSTSPLITRAFKNPEEDDEDWIMPPPKEKKPLTPEEIKIMTQWVDEGAVWNLPPGTAGAK